MAKTNTNTKKPEASSSSASTKPREIDNDHGDAEAKGASTAKESDLHESLEEEQAPKKKNDGNDHDRPPAARDANWLKRFEELKTFRDTFGHSNVLARHNVPSLYKWVCDQREQRRLRDRGEPNGLTDERLAILEGLGFDFDRTMRRDDDDNNWDVRFNELVEFHGRHGHTCVPSVFEENRPLGRWVNRQRCQYKLRQKGKPHHMFDNRLEALENLGFQWSAVSRSGLRPKSMDWDEKFNELLEFHSKHGHTCVPCVYERNRPLGRWVTNQRCQYSFRQKGKPHQMYDNRLIALENIGFKWDAVGRRGIKSATRPEENYGLPQNHFLPQYHEVEEAEEMEEEHHEEAEAENEVAPDDCMGDTPRIASSYSTTETQTAATATYGSSMAAETATMMAYGSSTTAEAATPFSIISVHPCSVLEHRRD